MITQQTLVEKIWSAHRVVARGSRDLMAIDRHLIHEATSTPSFELLAERKLGVVHPQRALATTDHMVATHPGRHHDSFQPARAYIRDFQAAVRKAGIALFDLDSPDQGIAHVIGAEMGAVLPGMTVVCGDSHTCTNGALGALAFGIGSTDVAHVLAHQALWMARPKTMRVTITGSLASGVHAKDVALAMIGRFSTDAGTGFAVEYAGSAVSAMSIEERMTLCNLSIEFGSRIGLIAPDDKVFSYVAQRRFAPQGAALDSSIAAWRDLASNDGAVFDSEVGFDATSLGPMVTWGNSPEDVMPIDGVVPNPESAPDAARRERWGRALDYVGLKPGQPIAGTPIDVAFIGSCTNARISDLRLAAAVVNGRKVAASVRALVVPGSQNVKRQAEAEGLDRIFRDAGFEWRESGCSLCVAVGPDSVQRGKRCAATSNRNFENRQGPGAITHLMSPVMVAAAAVAGCIADVRRLAS